MAFKETAPEWADYRAMKKSQIRKEDDEDTYLATLFKEITGVEPESIRYGVASREMESSQIGELIEDSKQHRAYHIGSFNIAVKLYGYGKGDRYCVVLSTALPYDCPEDKEWDFDYACHHHTDGYRTVVNVSVGLTEDMEQF